jgi:hypothetical protein
MIAAAAVGLSAAAFGYANDGAFKSWLGGFSRKPARASGVAAQSPSAPAKVIALDAYVAPGVPVALSNVVAEVEKTDNDKVDGVARVKFQLMTPGSAAVGSVSLTLFEFNGGGRLRRVGGWLREVGLSPGSPQDASLELRRRLTNGDRLVLAVERASGAAGTWETSFTDLAQAVALLVTGRGPLTPAVQASAQQLPDDFGADYCAGALRRAMALSQAGDKASVTSFGCNQSDRSYSFTYQGKSLTR